MLVKLRSRLTYANAMATIAVFIALGGSSYATLRVTSKNVPKDALTGADIKNITGKDVRNNSLTGADVKNLTSADVANGRLLAEDFAPGQLPQGRTGPSGKDATNLFAYISDPGVGSQPTVAYGDGVTSVADAAPGRGRYYVTFNRSVQACVVQAIPGKGDPPGKGIYILGAHLTTEMDYGGANEVRINAVYQGVSGTSQYEDTSFLITAFCP